MAAQTGTAARVVEIAEAEVGYLEKASNYMLDNKTANAGYNNYTKYNRDCGFGNGPIWYWCNSFTSWCAMKAGVPSTVVPKTASCAYTRDFFRSRGRLHLRSSGYKPVAGDLVLFTTSGYPNGSGHIGIVRSSDSKYVYTIEGNTSAGGAVVPNGGSVCKKSYPLSKSSIYGYCHPDYKVVQEDDELITTVTMYDCQTKKNVSVSAIVKNDTNYIKLRDLEKFSDARVVYDSAKKLPAVDLARDDKTVKVELDGKPLDVAGIWQNDANFVSIRNLLEQMGYEVAWNNKTQTVLVTSPDNQ